jgi:1,4-alpha-glucan branching enzyme
VRTRGDERFSGSAEMYRARFAEALERFEIAYNRDLVSRFKRLQEAGLLEIVTSCATHAFLPCHDSAHARAQVRIGVKAYRRHFERDPTGIWLPECGFVPGLDRLLASEGLRYLLVDSHAIEFADPAPTFGTYSPVVCPSGVAAFPRDRESSAQVWSAQFGYPADGRYREFYRDLGHDLETRALEPVRQPDSVRRNVGIKYHRVTDRRTPLHEKQPYVRSEALDAVDEHASHFVFARSRQIQHWSGVLSRPAVAVVPYDAELFGHWWFEGPEFLDLVVRKAIYDQQSYRLSTPSDVLECGLDFQVAMPAASSWGAYGYNDTWLNDGNCWIWPHLHHVTEEMAKIAGERPHPGSALEQRALNQLAREAVLASSSDWPFMLTMGTTVPYAEQRVRTHTARFNRLIEQIRAGAVMESWLAQLEHCDNIFSYIDYRDFAPEAL